MSYYIYRKITVTLIRPSPWLSSMHIISLRDSVSLSPYEYGTRSFKLKLAFLCCEEMYTTLRIIIPSEFDNLEQTILFLKECFVHLQQRHSLYQHLQIIDNRKASMQSECSMKLLSRIREIHWLRSLHVDCHDHFVIILKEFSWLCPFESLQCIKVISLENTTEFLLGALTDLLKHKKITGLETIELQWPEVWTPSIETLVRTFAQNRKNTKRKRKIVIRGVKCHINQDNVYLLKRVLKFCNGLDILDIGLPLSSSVAISLFSDTIPKSIHSLFLMNSPTNKQSLPGIVSYILDVNRHIVNLLVPTTARATTDDNEQDRAICKRLQRNITQVSSDEVINFDVKQFYNDVLFDSKANSVNFAAHSISLPFVISLTEYLKLNQTIHSITLDVDHMQAMEFSTPTGRLFIRKLLSFVDLVHHHPSLTTIEFCNISRVSVNFVADFLETGGGLDASNIHTIIFNHMSYPQQLNIDDIKEIFDSYVFRHIKHIIIKHTLVDDQFVRVLMDSLKCSRVNSLEICIGNVITRTGVEDIERMRNKHLTNISIGVFETLNEKNIMPSIYRLQKNIFMETVGV